MRGICFNQVYPRFDSLAKLWASFNEEHELLKSHKATICELQAALPWLRNIGGRYSRSPRNRIAQDEARTLPPLLIMQFVHLIAFCRSTATRSRRR